MNFILIILLSSFSFGKALSMKDLSISADISDIKKNVEKPMTTVAKIDLGPDPLNMSSKKNYDPGNTTYRPLLSPTELAKRQPAPESIGRYFPD